MKANQFIEKYEYLFKQTQEQLAHTLMKLMKQLSGYEAVEQNGSFLLYINKEKDWAPCLVAHLDTVHPQPSDYEMVPFSKNTKIWSPSGLGADDRAGVVAILEMLERGHRPHVLFTFDEEIGAVGSNRMLGAVPHEKMSTVSYFLQIDRRGTQDIVFYDNDNEKFQKDIIAASDNYFVEAIGSFSDISVLMSHYSIPGANISAGYVNEHQLTETMDVVAWNKIVSAAETILKDEKFNQEEYNFVPSPPIYGNYGGGSSYLYNNYQYGSYTNYRDACKDCGMVGLVNEKGLCDWCEAYEPKNLTCYYCGTTLEGETLQDVCKDCEKWHGGETLKTF